MPPLAESEQHVVLPPYAAKLTRHGSNPLVVLGRALATDLGVPRLTASAQLLVTLIPALFVAGILLTAYRSVTAPVSEVSATGLIELGGAVATESRQDEPSGLVGVPPAGEVLDLNEPPAERAVELSPPPGAEGTPEVSQAAEPTPSERPPPPLWFWIMFSVGLVAIALIYWLWNWERLQVFKMLLTSFFPLALLILAVLGSIVLGLATPAEAAALGAFGGVILAAAYRFAAQWSRVAPGGSTPSAAVLITIRELGGIIKESSFLTAKTSAMVCWLFVGSAIFSAAFALLGGQEIIERWVLSLDMTPLQFMILAQFIIFVLGWPLEWTEIIVIFMPIFIPMLPHFNIDPLFFGILVALNLQTAFLSPPVAMAAFYLKGVAPPHVTLNQIFAGMMPFMAIVVVCLALLYIWPGIALWLPQVVYGR
jgi:TRAP-type mannitol/chloroaromatic compound transport system permease large subunit